MIIVLLLIPIHNTSPDDLADFYGSENFMVRKPKRRSLIDRIRYH